MERLLRINESIHIVTKQPSAAPCTPQIITLVYHSINTWDTDPWGICVSPAHFEQQVQYLKAHCNVIGIADVITQLATGNIVHNSICLTFDDGYADNYRNAKPILEKYDCPATFFIPTAFIGETTPFWWDELENILLCSKKLPACLSLQINGQVHSYAIGETKLSAEQQVQHANWKWHQQAPTERCTAFLNVWQALRSLNNEEIKASMASIRQWAGSIVDTDMHRLPISEDQLRTLSKNRLFTIGMHTHTHADLATKDKHGQLEEIVTCRGILSRKYGIESNCLAYPYGRYNADTIDVVEYLGLKACFTTRPAGLTIHTDSSILGRYQVFNGCGDSVKHQLGI